MTGREHSYAATVVWTGDRGTGTSAYQAYSRAHEVRHLDKPTITGSSDAAFRGDASCWNPEDLLVASLSSCHMLSFLHLAAEAGICVRGYSDAAVGIMREDAEGGGRFVSVTLRPAVTLSTEVPAERLLELHEGAHRRCFIASSVNFPVSHEPGAAAVASVEAAESRS